MNANISYSDEVFFGKVASNSMISLPRQFKYSLGINRFYHHPPRLINSLDEINISLAPLVKIDHNLSVAKKIISVFKAEYVSDGQTALDNNSELALLSKLNLLINKRQKIVFRLLGVPFKCPNQLKVFGTLPDIGEYYFVHRLANIIKIINEFYPPGAKFIIVAESRAFVDIFDITEHEATNYREKVKNYIKTIGQSANLELIDLVESLKAVPEFDEEQKKQAKLVANSRLVNNVMPSIVLSMNVRQYRIDDLMIVFNKNLGYHKLLPYYASIRKDIFNRAKNAATKYVAFHQAREKLSTSIRCFPHTISCSMTPKVGSLIVSPVDGGLFPHHGIGLINKNGRVSVAYEIDLLRTSNCRPIYVKNDLHPIAYEIL